MGITVTCNHQNAGLGVFYPCCLVFRGLLRPNLLGILRAPQGKRVQPVSVCHEMGNPWKTMEKNCILNGSIDINGDYL